ncbi:MAG: MmcQ/YjbR family DNA-binding protein [Gemmatimonadaceae bacterium]
MTAAEFRRIALSLPDVIEGSHMGHADFRVGGKIFATLGYPSDHFAAVMLSPQDQDLIMRDHPKTFAPAAGAWGASGSTTVVLRGASKRAVAIALEAAWRKRAPKRLASALDRQA